MREKEETGDVDTETQKQLDNSGPGKERVIVDAHNGPVANPGIAITRINGPRKSQSLRQ